MRLLHSLPHWDQWARSFHRGRRVDKFSSQFKKLLIPGKIGQVLCLGNLTSSGPYSFLRGLAPDFHAVKGDFDVDPLLANHQHQHQQNSPPPAVGATAPLSKVVTHGRFRVGMIHGHTLVPPGDADVLLIAARQMDVDVLLWAGTHRFEAYEMEGRFFINPGSATGSLRRGSWEDGEEPLPSFVLKEVS